jgi:hypothetical protein
MDLGSASIIKSSLRMPSAWIQDGPDHHLCPTCAQKELREFAAAR